MFLHQFLHVDEVGCDLTDRLLKTGITHRHLNLLGHVGDVVPSVAAIDDFVVIEHLDHVAW